MITFHQWQEFEFRYRIFISLSIVLIACVVAYGLSPDQRTLTEIIAGDGGKTAGFILAAVFCLIASLLRMSAGTALRSGRVMSFKVRPEVLVVQPPYTLVRNPIYLADILAAVGFGLCMPVTGFLYPFLLLLHYAELVQYEEQQLRGEHGDRYDAYIANVPRLLPSFRSLTSFFRTIGSSRIDRDGCRYNALYLFFIPGLCLSVLTGEFFHAVLAGLPGVGDWAYWHTKKGLQPVYPEHNHEH